MQQIGADAPAGDLVVSSQERVCAAGLTASRAQQFLASRGWMRSCLSTLHAVDPLEVPLTAPPGAAPQLPDEWGYVSLSHCADACLLGWSQQPIGVDLERADRKLHAAALVRRFFTAFEQGELMELEGDQLRRQVLDRWLVKEADQVATRFFGAGSWFLGGELQPLYCCASRFESQGCCSVVVSGGMATWGCRFREGISAGLSALRSVNNLQLNRHECCLGWTPLNEGINVDASLRDSCIY